MKLTINASVILEAIAQGKAISSDWQAQFLEVLLIPAILQYWRSINNNRPLTIKRHEGLPYHFTTSENNHARCDRNAWREIAGHVFWYSEEGLSRWNSARDDYYGHASSTAWDGVRRDTNHQAIVSLIRVAEALQEGRDPHETYLQDLQRSQIILENDLTSAKKVAIT